MTALRAALLAAALAATARGQDLGAEIERLAEKHRLGSAAAGVFASRVDSGETLADRRGAEAFPLASVTKLFTACAALEQLGAAHEFTTRLWVARGADGEAALVAQGDGDPGISGRDRDGNPCAVFERWADSLLAAGVRKIARIDLDDARFGADRIASGWPKDQLAEWYCAPSGALSLNDNCVDVRVAPAKAGEPAAVTCSPDTAFVKIDNRCVTTAVRSEHAVSIWRNPGSNTIVVKGRFLAGAAPLVESVTVDDPGLYFGTVLRETLARKGLDAKDAPVSRLAARWEPPPGSPAPLASVTPLRSSLRVMLQRSQNFYAENLLRSLGPDGASLDACAAAASKALEPLGIAAADLALLDGSGLSRGNRASPATAVRLLSAAARRPWAGDFLSSLAAPGEPGTLQKRLPGFEKTLRAKTGTIAGVSNLAGYVDTPGGRVAFAIFVSQLKEGSAPAMAFQDDVVRLLSK